MREKICLDKGWYCHLNDIPMLPKTVTNEGSICGLAGPLESESKEPYSGGLQHLQRMLFNWQAFGYTIEAETPYKAVLKSKGLEMPETMAEMEGWFPVDLPHDFRLDFGYNRQDAQAAQGHFPEGVAWYRKTFPLSQEDLGSRIVIEIDGAMRGASVWFNGCFVGDHYSGYCGFQYDLTELAKYGEEGLNVLLIRLDTTIGPEGWWYEGGGLYRHVWLTKTAPIHVGRWGVHVQSQPQGADAKIRIHTTVDNDTDTSALVQLKTSILSPEGELIILEDAQGEVQGLESGVLHQQCQILKYHPWDVEDPALYTVRVEVLTQQGLQDVYEVPFGIRHIEYTKEGLMLNGRHLKIQGACVHLDWAGVGIAQHDAINEYKIKRLKEMGCNAYRSSHNAATIELLEACDRQGMLVLDENRVPEATPHRIADLVELIKRGRNHPCIFAWSMSNEEGISGSPQAERIIKKYMSIVKKLDPDRICFAAETNLFGEEAVEWIRKTYGIYGFNYPEAKYDNILYRQAREADPDLPIMSTENVSYLTTRGAYEDVPERGHCSCYGTRYDQMGKPDRELAGGAATPWQAMDFYKENPWTGGHFIWTGFDYRGETTPFFAHQTNSNYGVMDYCGYPKDTYYYYQAIFRKEPVIHIMPHWTDIKPVGEAVDVRIYTNCQEAELLLNGRSLGRKAKEDHWIGWMVPYEPGRLEVIGYTDGQETARDVQVTAGAPVQVQLMADRSTLRADGQDMAFVTARILDASGNVVPYAENTVHFQVEGDAKVIGCGNGDPGSFEDDRLPVRKAYAGLCMAMVQAGFEKGTIRVIAAAEGLQGDVLEIESE